MMPAIFVFGATPPTIMPMLNMDSITRKYPPRNGPQDPVSRSPKKSAPGVQQQKGGQGVDCVDAHLYRQQQPRADRRYLEALENLLCR